MTGGSQKPRGRPNRKGIGRKQGTHKKKATTYREKLAVVNYFTATNDMAMTRQEFYPELNDAAWDSKRKLIYEWKKKIFVI